MSRTRKAPLRTCVSCRTTSDKRELIRVARSKEGDVHVDTGGKGPGRGAYVCPSRGCFDEAIEHDRLGRALRVRLTEEDTERLRTEFEETLAHHGVDSDRG